ncbi:hypothetical protein [Acidovorax sp.]|uniref:hypothetical protein n=1 Tax=Acidovorax sp. TaxID=1872122 RepID=UPI00391DC9C5
MNLRSSEVAFLKALALSNESWSQAAIEALSDPPSAEWSEQRAAWAALAAHLSNPEAREAFHAVLSELLSGLTHSFLVTLDGGSSLAETTSLTIQDDQGITFKSFLHEFWPTYGGAAGA